MKEKKLAIIVPHFATGGMPEVVATELSFRKDWECHLFIYSVTGYDVQLNRVKAMRHVTIYEYSGDTEKEKNLDLMQTTIYGLGFRFVVQHDNALGSSFFEEHNIQQLRYFHSMMDLDDHRFAGVPYGYLAVNKDIMQKIFDSDPRFQSAHRKIHPKLSPVFSPIETENRFNPDLYNPKEIRAHYDIPQDAIIFLHVGIFCENKRQYEIYKWFDRLEIPTAKRLIFIGALAGNFQDYWNPFINELTADNRVSIVQECTQMEEFYAIANYFINASEVEGNPVAIREALAMNVPCILNMKCTGILESYKGAPMIMGFVYHEDMESPILTTWEMIKDCTQDRYFERVGYRCGRKFIQDNYNPEQYISSMNRIYKSAEDEGWKGGARKSQTRVSSLESPSSSLQLEYGSTIQSHSIRFNQGNVSANVIAFGLGPFGLRVLDDRSKTYWEETQLGNQTRERAAGFAFESPKDTTFRPLLAQITLEGMVVAEKYLALANKRVLIDFCSHALGDTIAWLPSVIAFSQQNQCHVTLNIKRELIDLVTLLIGDDFKDSIHVTCDEEPQNFRAWYQVGIFDAMDDNWRRKPLSQIAADILGIEIPLPRLNPDPMPEFTKYLDEVDEIVKRDRSIVRGLVTISETGTQKGKRWNCENGWQELVNRLTTEGYTIAVIQKEKTDLKGVLDWTGDLDARVRAYQISKSRFFIGGSSGLAWLAHAVGTFTYLINGFTYSWFEFADNVHHIERLDVCRGCFNRPKFTWDKSYDWCPTNLDYECTRFLSPDYVYREIMRRRNCTEEGIPH